MAGSVNKAIILGNLGRDPEVRTIQAGGKIANLAIATSDSWTDKASGERKEQTEWHRVVILNDALVAVVEKYCHKGTKIYVEGQIKTRKWTDSAGVEKVTTEIVVGRFNGVVVILDKVTKAEDESF